MTFNVFTIMALTLVVLLALMSINSLPMWLRTLATIILLLILSWAIVCGIVRVLFYCFSLVFTLRFATGIYILLLIAAEAIILIKE